MNDARLGVPMPWDWYANGPKARVTPNVSHLEHDSCAHKRASQLTGCLGDTSSEDGNEAAFW